MSPESLTSPADVDGRGDLYALGAVGYFALTGQHVFDGATVLEVCAHHLHSEPVPPSQRLGDAVPADLEALLLACLRKHPADRPQSACELRERLEACQDAGVWTPSMAREWWANHGETLQVKVEKIRSKTETIAVDLARS